jgi:hypothetical protein
VPNTGATGNVKKHLRHILGGGGGGGGAGNPLPHVGGGGGGNTIPKPGGHIRHHVGHQANDLLNLLMGP